MRKVVTNISDKPVLLSDVENKQLIFLYERGTTHNPKGMMWTSEAGGWYAKTENGNYSNWTTREELAASLIKEGYDLYIF